MKTKNEKKVRTTTRKQTYRRLLRDERGISPYVAVIVLIALALMIYAGAKVFGEKVNEKFEAHGTEGVEAIQSAPGTSM